ncbi:aldehyde ferredoxin oxidoreductase N-terminal domain-containing protein [Geobacter argillaceus]|uniref:Aldehyde:ferredoxin oxidoreductase n=1 Tax=Geobacter argillaceus TaxID=345631 RepID=A0A562VHR8_9BACT|nr:aldehyde ferredoxin oxidoreductase N-terminal domain-containing protein [Geobacter argillaceus]TWJ17503.1 aldehyde:ferredoxin oxidoreductase [Geobacter argillaceus]
MRYTETGFDLEVDLTKGNIERVATSQELTGRYLGGQGTAAQILWDRVPPEVDPLSPNNLLIFSAGLLDGAPVPGANRTSISTISPQSNLYINSGLGGFFGPELKQAGYDKIVIRGKSDNLVYLWIHNNKVEIRDAGHLQGKNALETAALIRQELKDPMIQVAAIGLAGENRVFQASIEHANSSASRGVGVVMGDKRLKAIAVRGSRDIPVARPAELFERCNRQYGDVYDNPHCGDVFLKEADDSWHVSHLGWRNPPNGFWSEETTRELAVRVERDHMSYQWENYSQEMEEVHETIVEKSEIVRGTGCFNCPKNCHLVVSLPGERIYFLKNYSRLAYAMAAYPDLKLNYDVLSAMQNYGLDEFAIPQVVDFVVTLLQAGILTDADLPEFPADSSGRFLYLLEKIARREGVGDALANGLYQAARTIGKGAEAYERSAKKIEQLPVRLQEANYPHFLMYAVGDKMNITQIEGSFPQIPIPDRKEREAFVAQWDAAPERFKKWFLDWEPGEQLSIEAAVNIVDWNEAMHFSDEALGICPFLSSFRGQYGGHPSYHLHNLPTYISLATGEELDAEGLEAIAKRTRLLVRAINVRRGLRSSEDKVPQELWENRNPELEQQHLDAYYAFKGWTPEGIPTRETLVSAGLEYVSRDFAARGILTDN